MIEVIPARPFHIGTIARRMREIDRRECAMFDMSPKEALRQGLIGSAVAWTALVDHRPEAMFGAVPISALESRGRIWLLMTDEAERHRKALVRLGWRYTQACHEHFYFLENMVHAHNNVSIRWLARLGYAIGGVDVYNGEPIRRFVRCAGPR